MEFVVAAVVILAVLALLNLLISCAVVRRLRDHEERLGAPGKSRSEGRDPLIGRRLPAFDALSTRGERVSGSAITGPDRLVAFFSAGCAPCRDQAAEFARHPDADRVAIVLMEPAAQTDQEAILAALGDSPIVVAEPTGSAVAEALGVHRFPQLVLLDEAGVIVASRHSLAALTAGAR
ncbi:TlpA family protein disulfide reductase [Nocardia sp. NPDC059180]|uniref:TlpA family protein disulfide reductase n=1 Tax=Nocardia sp. NPDC059180 TaxID=3346761 RepID=UPI00367EA821